MATPVDMEEFRQCPSVRLVRFVVGSQRHGIRPLRSLFDWASRFRVCGQV
jgi:hypothetical protein